MALFKNKETDKKRKGENIIGKIIYGFLLFAPLMSILFTSLYTVFNKNAYESYSGKDTIIVNTIPNYKYQTNEVNDATDFVNGNIYKFNSYNNNTTKLNVTAVIFLERNNINEVLNNTLGSYFIKNEYENTYYQINGPIVDYYLRGVKQNSVLLSNLPNQCIFYFVYYDSPEVSVEFQRIEQSDYNIIESYTNIYQEVTELDNAFEYGMYKTEQSNIYNWSKSTGTYTVLQNVCTGIGITNTFVPMLMAYWLLISIIYFLFDIALILIWAVHDKIHALKDAI